MDPSRNGYVHVLSGRYPSNEMQHLHSDSFRYSLWRRLWLELARGEQQLGIPITDAQIAEMEANLNTIDFDEVARIETELLHDVDAHRTHFGNQAPSARGIIHHGATSCYITDNADLIIMKHALELLAIRTARVIDRMADFAMNVRHRDIPMLGFTHYQVAQPVTLGKRVALWINDLVMDLEGIERVRANLVFRGVKGTVGTQASFLSIFHGDHLKVKELDKYVTRAFGFSESFIITGQTYTRRQDSEVVSAVAALAGSLTKFATDFRLLQHDGELGEPFKEKQKGSSAMPHKRNPMKCERICGLARVLKAMPGIAVDTHSAQWLERTLDDSSARRIFLPDTFLLADAILLIAQSIFEGARVYPNVIKRRLDNELPLLAVEEIMVAMVEHGIDRQEVYAHLRKHAIDAVERVKDKGEPNDFLVRVQADPFFAPIADSYQEILDPKRFIGRANEQLIEFIGSKVVDIRTFYADQLEGKVELKV